jgi:hypothetical protein
VIPLLVGFALGACDAPPEMSAAAGPEAPVGSGAENPDLRPDPEGRLVLSWVEPTAAGSALRFSRREAGAWTAARTIARGSDWLVNWADRATMVFGAERSVAAHWRTESGLQVSISSDGGATWGDPIVPHAADTLTARSFVSIAPVSGGFVTVWLDGREGEGPMTLRAATLGADGTASPSLLLDERACDCCPTASVTTEAAIVVAYRDRSESEVRDISICRMDLASGDWSEPASVHVDGWSVAGCPVEGPALAAARRHVACAWFTMGASGEEPQVNVALSADDGRTFGPPLRVDLGDPVGRCDVAALPGGSWLVSWMESRGEEAEIRVRRITAGGKMDPSSVAAVVPNDRAVGFPRLAATEPASWITWTEPGEVSHVRLRRIPSGHL